MNYARYIATLLCVVATLPAVADHHHKPLALIGVWSAEATSDQGERDITWTFSKKDGKIVGTSLDKGSGDEQTLDRIKVKGKTVVLEIDVEQDGNVGVIRVEAEEKSPGKLTGEWVIESDDGTKYMDGKISAVKQVAFSGNWDTVTSLPDGGTLKSELKLKGKNAKLEGLFDGDNGETELDKIAVKDNTLHLDLSVDYDGTPLDVQIKAKPEGDNKLVGNWVAMQDGNTAAEGRWKAVRKAKSLAGKWDVEAGMPNGEEYNGTLNLAAENGKYSGTSKRDGAEANKLDKVTVDGEKLEFSFGFEANGYAGTIAVMADMQSDGSLKGEWTLTSKDGEEMARESWKAQRD